MSEALKPCPFCGGKPTEPRYYNMDSYWYLGCYTPGHPVIEFKDGASYSEGPDGVIKSWNRRAEDGGKK